MAEALDSDSDCDVSSSKRFKYEPCSSPSSTTTICGPSLLHLSDDVLLLILSSLKSCDLISLSRTCRRLVNVSFDHTLWSRTDCRDPRFTDDSLGIVMSRLCPSTQFLALDFMDVATLNAEYVTMPIYKIVEDITSKCTSLHTLLLESVIIKAAQLKIDAFPPTLRHLSLKHSLIDLNHQKASYLFNISVTMPFLEVLILSECHWLEAHSLLAIAKCARLRELRLDGCQQLGNCMAYCSMAARFSFKCLETLDLRGTQMGDSEVACFNRVTSLRHLYLASPGAPVHPYMWHVSPEHVPHACLIVCQRGSDNRFTSQSLRLRRDLHRDELQQMIEVATHHPMKLDEVIDNHDPEVANKEEASLNLAPQPGGSGTKPSRTDGGECSSWLPQPPPVPDSETPSCSRDAPKRLDDAEKGGVSGIGEVRVVKTDDEGDKEKQFVVVMVPQEQGSGDGVEEEAEAGARPEERDRRDGDRDATKRSFEHRNQLCGYFVPPIPRRGTDLVTDNAMYDLFDAPQRDRTLYVRLGCEPPTTSRLESLVVRNYRGITDNTLLVVSERDSIRYLDVTGTSVTRQGVENFKRLRSDVNIISDFSDDAPDKDLDNY